jgi:inorganic pyrophosphatase
MNTLQRLKQGKKNSKLVNFPGTEEKVALVILSSNEITDATIKAEDYIKEKNIMDEDDKGIVQQAHIIYKSLRDKDDTKKQLADSFDEFFNTLDNTEIQYFMVEYSMLTNENSPFLNAVNEETFEQLKKTLEKMQWSDLNGPSLIALRSFLLTLV